MSNSRGSDPAYPLETSMLRYKGLSIREAAALQIFAVAVTMPTSLIVPAKVHASEAFALADVFVDELDRKGGTR